MIHKEEEMKKFFKKLVGLDIAELLTAVGNDDFDEIKKIISTTIHIDKVQNGTFYNALALATLHNNFKMVKFLLENGADPNVPVTPYSQTCLHMAAEYGWTDIAKLLIEYGAIPNVRVKFIIRKKTPLMIAQEKNHQDIVAILEQFNT